MDDNLRMFHILRIEWMNCIKWMNNRTNEQTNEQTSKRINDWMTECWSLFGTEMTDWMSMPEGDSMIRLDVWSYDWCIRFLSLHTSAFVGLFVRSFIHPFLHSLTQSVSWSASQSVTHSLTQSVSRSVSHSVDFHVATKAILQFDRTRHLGSFAPAFRGELMVAKGKLHATRIPRTWKWLRSPLEAGK